MISFSSPIAPATHGPDQMVAHLESHTSFPLLDLPYLHQGHYGFQMPRVGK